MRLTRRDFLTTAAAAAGSTMLSLSPGAGFAAEKTAAARYRRYNVASAEGQRMLVSYARGIQAMLDKPADDPQNWFRNAFVHFLDCPHGNWWFYVWHRGYVGYFERTIRKLSGDPSFAMPFWDWTTAPEMPATMFNGTLTPTAEAFAPYTGNLKKFTDFIKPALQRYWNTLSSAQRSQLSLRGYNTFDDAWNDVTGYNVAQQAGISGNMAYAITCGARYLSRDNPKLDPKTAYAVSPFIVDSGLQPQVYYDPTISKSFTSTKTNSHVMQPDAATQFSVLEGFPHNKVHNCIGGVGAIDPGPYGNMTNFLSPVDPVFFLHHANMDRLWDVWTKRQIAAGRPIAPTGSDLAPFMNEPFLFYVDGDGKYISGRAADWFSTAVFDYDYAPGFGSAPTTSGKRKRPAGTVDAYRGTQADGEFSLELPAPLVKSHVADTLPGTLIAEVTLERPDGVSGAREFDVVINAPDGVTQVDGDSPYYAGTVAFFGPTMSHAGMQHNAAATFAVPLRRTLQAFNTLEATAAKAKLDIRLVPSGDNPTKPVVVRDITVRQGG